MIEEQNDSNTIYVQVYGYLRPDIILGIYKKLKEEFGVASLGRVRDYCKRKGIVNPATGQPPTRQGIYSAMQKTVEGRKLLAQASHTHYLSRPSYGFFEEREARDKKRLLIQVPKA